MKAERAKALVDMMSRQKISVLIGVQAFPGTDSEWNVLIAPGQIFDVITLAIGLHYRGFSCQHGPVDGQDGQEQFVILDVLPEMLPEADTVEDVEPSGPMEWSVRLDSPIMRFVHPDATEHVPPAEPGKARTGGERIWTPGDEIPEI